MTCEVGFSHIHTFKYSVRSGTRAERMPEQVPERIKQERSEVIRNISNDNKRKYRTSMTGKTQNVLVEKYNPRTRQAKGYGQHYFPVELISPEDIYNQIVPVKLVSLGAGEDPMMKGIRIPNI